MAAYGGIRRAPIWPAAMTDGMTEAQLAVVEPPYHNRLGRPMVELDEEGEVVVVEGGGKPHDCRWHLRFPKIPSDDLAGRRVGGAAQG